MVELISFSIKSGVLAGGLGIYFKVEWLTSWTRMGMIWKALNIEYLNMLLLTSDF